MEQFESQEVIDLVESALAKGGQSAFVSEQTIPLGLGQGDMLGRLFEQLTKVINIGDAQMVFDDLRDEIYAGIEAPDLKTLHTITMNCRKCREDVKPEPHLPRWNLKDPDCLFIVEAPFYSEEQTQFFVDGLVKAGFSSQRVALTYVNRCPAVGNYQPENVRNCSNYLLTEIQVLKPKLLVPLGLAATSVLLGTDVKMADIRGAITWLGPWALLPTYSPAYALKSGGSVTGNYASDIASAYNFCYGD